MTFRFRIGRWYLLGCQAIADRLAAVRSGLPRTVIRFGGGLGDHLLMSAVARELCQRDQGPVWILSNHPELFTANPDVRAIFPEHPDHSHRGERLGANYHLVTYTHPDPADPDLIIAPPRPAIAEMCRLAGITGPVRMRPWFHFTKAEGEVQSPEPLREFVTIQSAAGSPSRPKANKEWPHGRFQELADHLSSRGQQLVQLGSPADPLLPGVRDLRGRTDIRQTARLLADASFHIGPEGFLMHLARAVETRSVIVYGGRILPSEIGYPCNENLSVTPPCSPCWRSNQCDFDRICLKQITVEMALEAVDRLKGRLDQPLETDTCILP